MMPRLMGYEMYVGVPEDMLNDYVFSSEEVGASGSVL